MAFHNPTLQILMERSASDIEAVIPIGDAHLRRNYLNILAKINAGAAHGMHGHLAWLGKQIFPQTADWENLQRWGELRQTTPLPATLASGVIIVTGTPNMLIKSGEKWQRSDGFEYSVSQAINLDATGRAQVQVVASELGVIGNAATGGQLRSIRAMAGITPTATIEDIGGGADAETLEAYRERVMFRWQNPPKTGCLTDYEAWALEATPAATRAWATANEMTLNSITLRILCDNSTEGPLPSAAVLNEVHAYVRKLMPATPVLFVVSPVAIPIDIELSIEPNTPEVKAAIELEIKDFFITDPDLKPEGKLYCSRLSEAISKASDERAHTLFFPAENIAFSAGEVPVVNNIIWRE